VRDTEMAIVGPKTGLQSVRCIACSHSRTLHASRARHKRVLGSAYTQEQPVCGSLGVRDSCPQLSCIVDIKALRSIFCTIYARLAREDFQ
jgi:hypothetical protein